MLFRHRPFTPEAVSAGHPDTLCDRVSDPILDPFLTPDPYSRAACAIGVASSASMSVEAHGTTTGENVR